MYKPAMYNTVCVVLMLLCCSFQMHQAVYADLSSDFNYPLKSFFSMRYYFELPYFQHTSSKIHINPTCDAHSNSDKAALKAA